MAVVTNPAIYKQIDRINKQILGVSKAEKYVNTEILMRQYQQVLQSALPAEYIKMSKKGVIQISKSKAAQAALSPEMLERIEGLQTAGEYKAEIMNAVAEEEGITPEEVTIDQMREYSDDMTTVRNAEDAHGKINYNADDASIMQAGGVKSYKELAEVVRRYEDQLAKEKAEKAKAAAEYDAEHANSTSKAKRRKSASDQVR